MPVAEWKMKRRGPPPSAATATGLTSTIFEMESRIAASTRITSSRCSAAAALATGRRDTPIVETASSSQAR